MSVLTRPTFTQQNTLTNSQNLSEISQNYYPKRTSPQQTYIRSNTPLQQQAQYITQQTDILKKTYSSNNPMVYYPYDPTYSALSILKDHSNLNYYSPNPTDTDRLNPLELTSLKHMDVDQIQDCFAKSIQTKRDSEFASYKRIHQMFDENDEIRNIKSTIKQAELNRGRAHQIHEHQTRRLQNLIKDTELDEKVLENLEKERQEEEEIKRKKKEDLINAKHIIQQQLRDKEKAKEESKKEYERDKMQINALVQKVLNEDKDAYEEAQRKKAIAKQYMDSAYAEREERKRKAKEDERLEKEKERKYLEDVAKREFELQAKQRAIQDEKDKIFDKLCKERAKQQAEKDYWEDVRNQLYDEETNRQNRIKELEEKEKLQRQKEEMLASAIEQMKRKQEIKQREKELEDEIKDKMLAKFAEDEKLEEQNRINRRNKMLVLQDEIEKQWKLKLAQYQKQKERELSELEYQKRVEEDRRKLIEQEKARLIKENEDLLKSYFPKGYYGVMKTLKYDK